MSTKLPTPTRTLVETSVGVREAARNLQKLSIHWESPQQAVVILKPDKQLIEKAQLVIDHLLKSKMVVYVEDTVLPSIDKSVKDGELRPWNAEYLRASLMYFNNKTDGNTDKTKNEFVISSHQHALNKFSEPVQSGTGRIQPEDVDLVITLGGDGTVLYASWLFQGIVPPILPFHLGTLGFLTVFDFSHYKSLLDKVLTQHNPPIDSVGVKTGGRRLSVTALPISQVKKGPDGVRITLRMRLTCAVYRCKTILKTKLDNETNTDFRRGTSLNNRPIPDILEPLDDSTNIPKPDEVFQILNDLVVDRGPSPYMSSLEVFGDGNHLTTVQADGLVVATPTGSTAYSLSTGGSMCHPEVPAVLLTPICPHTLSFRPMLLPDSMELKIVVPQDSRNGAWASFDGRHRLELFRGDTIVVSASPFPVPTLCRFDQTSDWFDSLGRCLRWNERGGRQKSFVWGQGVVEAREKD